MAENVYKELIATRLQDSLEQQTLDTQRDFRKGRSVFTLKQLITKCSFNENQHVWPA